MKKINYFIIIYILIIIALVISPNSILKPKGILLGELYKNLYYILERNINSIETNMNEVTISNDNWKWWELKETNIEDEQLKNTYNSLVSDIRRCYLLSSDLKNKTYDNIKILNFKNKEYITSDELSELNAYDSCLKEFDKYNTLVLSDDEILSERVRAQIHIIIDYEPESSNNKDFDELLYDEVVTIDKIANLTKWLKMEYYSRKK